MSPVVRICRGFWTVTILAHGSFCGRSNEQVSGDNRLDQRARSFAKGLRRSAVGLEGIAAISTGMARSFSAPKIGLHVAVPEPQCAFWRSPECQRVVRYALAIDSVEPAQEVEVHELAE